MSPKVLERIKAGHERAADIARLHRTEQLGRVDHCASERRKAARIGSAIEAARGTGRSAARDQGQLLSDREPDKGTQSQMSTARSDRT